MRTGIAEAHISLNVDFPAQNPEFPEQDLLPPQRALSHADLLSLEASALEEAGGRTVIDMRAISLRYPRVSQGAQSASSSLHQRQSTLASESSEPRLNRDEPDVDSEGESGGWRVPPMKSSDRASRVRTSKSTEVSLRQHFIPKKKFGDLFRHVLSLSSLHLLCVNVCIRASRPLPTYQRCVARATCSGSRCVAW